MTPAESRRRAPRHTLSADRIVDAALHLLDTTTAEELSMRTLAAELGVGTMTLYTYFRSKDEILQAARDRVLDSFHPPAVDGGWEEQVRACCTALYLLLVQRPAVMRVLATGMHGDDEFADTATAALEFIVGQLRAAGLDRECTARGYLVLLQYTFGAALGRVRAEAHDPGALPRLSPQAHPMIADLAPELLRARGCGTDQYIFGLDLLLTGLRGSACAVPDPVLPSSDAAVPPSDRG
ncbi:TetR/AcrR family transcriptional regulator [Nocardia sp. alder85J]|uniref:TetR/AcrR family transcriptional regulator n=1 Tax=Nocardia sp. alder85J TaxID=2862949 RepID=UPI001CD25FFC|nr:TetR/AcrR family transcriptional regulator [Nocardia sp. alder85J]MCX4091125.1 TetR/AcrR family transcriptional regulator [Nocardia sp. alder85J]